MSLKRFVQNPLVKKSCTANFRQLTTQCRTTRFADEWIGTSTKQRHVGVGPDGNGNTESRGIHSSIYFNSSRQKPFPFGIPTNTNHRFFSNEAMTPDEEEYEKSRVASLTPYEKEMELRVHDKQIKRLNTLRGINTGELYTWRGRFKALGRDYGVGFMVWYWTVWAGMAVSTYMAIELGNVDALAMISKLDTFTGYDLSSKIDPALGKIGLTIAVNECLEPVRLIFVVSTTKPVVDRFTSNY